MTKRKKTSDNIDFTRFQDLTRRLVAVPKTEADARRETVKAPTDRSSEKSARRK